MADTPSQRTRHPGLALLLALLSTTLAMLYVGRWPRALAYLAGYLLLLGIYIGGGFAGLRVFTMDLSYTAAYVVLTAMGMWDAWRIARHHREAFEAGWYSRWPFLAALPFVFAVSVFSLRAFVAEPFRIPAVSMEPVLRRGDFILAWKWPYRNYGTYGVTLTHARQPHPAVLPERGDIVLFRHTVDPRIVYIKRIVGMPGDRVIYDRGKLVINGKEAAHRTTGESLHGIPILEETQNDRRYRILQDAPSSGVSVSVSVPSGHYFVLGDNRPASADSRHWGPVPQNHLIGRPLWIWWSVGEDGRVRPARLGMAVR